MALAISFPFLLFVTMGGQPFSNLCCFSSLVANGFV
jgi:hypothetical protein